MQSLAAVVTSHEIQLERVKASSQRLEDLLNRSDEFAKMANALKENEDHLKMVLDALEERRPSLRVRLDISILSAVAGFGTGLWLDVDRVKVGIIVIVSALLTLPAEPYIQKSVRAIFKK